MHGYGWPMGWMVFLAFFVLFAMTVAWIASLRRAGWPQDRPSSLRDDDTPEEILRRRYARGEIDEEELERRMERLKRR